MVLAILIGYANGAVAQDPNLKWPPYAYALIRVTSPQLNGRIIGEFSKVSNDSLVFYADKPWPPVAIPLAQITRLEMQSGVDRPVGTWALLGFLVVGGGSGALMAWALNKHVGSFPRWGSAALVGTVLGAGGAFVGAVLAWDHPHATWATIPIPR